MMPGTQADSYVNVPALTKSLIVWQTLGEVLIFIILQLFVFISNTERNLITFPVTLTKDTFTYK